MENMEEKLAKGQQVLVHLTTENPGPAGFAERYNLRIGVPYRIIIAGSNPEDQATFDGVMTKLTVFADKDSFSIRELVLEKGLSWDNFSEKKPFKKERFGPPEDEDNGYTLIGFGKINDPDGFFRARDRILKGGQ